ncbi:MAG: FKBP-type peptidyl-prolyl cis-trans isomerase [Candidatus Electryonea clarkiae]|nr:FKBP-type peptidyl-prolyl cis-trans isomerase [Candidatus Electryonea clarkiae]MDP8286093.1 FKBP-type peptidyl-prolyl cis-trans isomerase [Candidatus Electryonea clarkiae]
MKRYLVIFVAISLAIVLAGCGGGKKETSLEAIEEAMVKINEGRMPDLKTLVFTETESGLEYVDLKDGDGLEAAAGHTVTVHYHGWLMSDRRFDSSLMTQEPIEFELGTGKVIKGWDEGVSGMQVGTYRLLRIPSILAYGSKGKKGIIPPNAPLVFFVKLIKIQ